MSLSPSPYTLDSGQLDAALDALTKAAEGLRPSPSEHRLYVLLGWCAKVAAISFVTTFVLSVLLLSGVAKISSDAVGFAGMGFLASGAAAFLLLLANATLIRDTLRQRAMVKRMGLHEVSYSAWKADTKRGPIERFGGVLMTALAVVMLVLMGLWGLSTDGGDVFEVVFGIALLVVGLVILAFRYLKRCRDQLEVMRNAHDLRDVLATMKRDTRGDLEVPADLLEKAARIETLQIARERADAVIAGIKVADRGYAVISSREATEQKTALPPADRLALEELIDEIASDPHARGSLLYRTDNDDYRESGPKPKNKNLRRACSTNEELEVIYEVDETEHRVQLVSAGLVRPAVTIEGLHHAG